MAKKRINELAVQIVEEGFSIVRLIDFTFHQNDRVAFRSAWILEQVYLKHPPVFFAEVDYFLLRFPQQTNVSAQRHFSKILLQLSGQQLRYTQLIPKETKERLIEAVFTWLVDERSPVAVKAHCLSILANFSKEYNWVKDELLQTIDFMVDKESIAFHSRAKKVKALIHNR